MGWALYDSPTAICLTAEVDIELRQRRELPTTKLIGARRIGSEKDPNSQKGRIAHLCSRLVLCGMSQVDGDACPFVAKMSKPIAKLGGGNQLRFAR